MGAGFGNSGWRSGETLDFIIFAYSLFSLMAKLVDWEFL